MPELKTRSARKHRHSWTGLWTTSWREGQPEPDKHLHDCIDRRCRHTLIGPGKRCDGTRSTHRVRP